MNQFSTMLLKNSLLSSFFRYNLVFNSLFEPWDIGTNKALEQKQMHITKVRDTTNATNPYYENPDFLSSLKW